MWKCNAYRPCRPICPAYRISTFERRARSDSPFERSTIVAWSREWSMMCAPCFSSRERASPVTTTLRESSAMLARNSTVWPPARVSVSPRWSYCSGSRSSILWPPSLTPTTVAVSEASIEPSSAVLVIAIWPSTGQSTASTTQSSVAPLRAVCASLTCERPPRSGRPCISSVQKRQPSTFAPYTGISWETGEPCSVIVAFWRNGSRSVPTIRAPPITKT